jgi:Major tropism determinant N-terminal domain
MAVKIQHRRGTASDWSTYNYVLAAGEIGIDTTNKQFKLGDGTSGWNSLAYRGIQGTASSGTGAQGVQGVQGYAGIGGVQANAIQWTQALNQPSSFTSQVTYPGSMEISPTSYGLGFSTGNGIELDNSSVSSTWYVTIPQDIAFGSPVYYGQTFLITRLGLQTVQIQGQSGVTIQAAQGVGQTTTTTTPKLRAYGSVATLMRVGSNRWYVFGDIVN